MRNAVLAAALTLPLLAAAVLAEPADTIAAVGEDASWLFIQTADGLRFDGQAITLTGIDPAVVMFTDRPHRAAELMPLARFVDAWTRGGDRSFQADPPNAGLTTLVDGKFQVATVELTEPRLDGTTLTYGVRVVEGTVPPAGGQTSLFIDGCNWGDTSGC